MPAEKGKSSPERGKALGVAPLFAIIGLFAVFRFLPLSFPNSLTALLSGLCLLASAGLLTIAVDLLATFAPRGLALATAALVAVLPEYAVEMYFAWQAKAHPGSIHFLLANMTGSNRLLLGFGWPLLGFLFLLNSNKKVIQLRQEQKVDVIVLYAATIYAFLIPFKGTLSLLDTLFYFALYAFYIFKTAKTAQEQEAGFEWLRQLPVKKKKKLSYLSLFVSCAGIYLSSGTFAASLIALGRSLHLEEYILVQWISPLASELPEIIVASLLVRKGMGPSGMGVLISAQIAQWSLLIGSLPLLFFLRGLNPVLPLDFRQLPEVLLTASQSLFGAWIIFSLSISLRHGLIIFCLYLLQALFPSTHPRSLVSEVYLLLILIGPLWRQRIEDL